MNIKYILLGVEGLVHTTIWNGHETVGMLKANLTSTNGTLLGNIDPMKLMIFPATKANGAFIPIESRRVRKMLRGEIPSLVAEVLSKENELKDVHFVNDVIPGTAAPSGVVHVLMAFGEMEIVCSLMGREGRPIELQVNIRDTNLHRVVGDALGTTKPDWKLFMSRGRDGAWINTDSDDARALMRGQTTNRITELTGESDMLVDAFKLVGAPTQRTIHIIVKWPGFPAIKAFRGIRRQWSLHWDHLNGILASFKGDKETAAISKVTWDKMKHRYLLQCGQQQPVKLNNENITFAAITGELRDTIKVSGQQGAMNESEVTHLLHDFFKRLFVTTGVKITVGAEHPLDSNKNAIKVSGFADFTFYDSGERICIVEVKREKVAAVRHQSDTVPQKGFVQALLGMEIVNTHSSRKLAVGIVSNYCEWTFMQMAYTGDGSKPTVLYDYDTLTRSTQALPNQEDMIRITSKLLGILTGEPISPSTQAE